MTTTFISFTKLPIHLKICIAVFCDYDTFIDLCDTYDDLTHLCIGRMSKRMLKRHDNLSELMYFERCKLWYPKYYNFKDDNLTWHKAYLRFHNFDNYKMSTHSYSQYGKLMELKLCHLLGELITEQHANIAAEIGNIAILEWLKSINVIMNTNSIKYVVRNGHLDVLKWLKKNNLLILSNLSLSSSYHLVYRYDNEFLDFLSNEGLAMDESVLVFSLVYSNIETLKWFEKKGIYPSQHGINLAIMNDNLNVLKWINKRRQLTNESIEYAKSANKTHILKWLNYL